MDLYYEVYERGYHIYDKNNPMFHVHQYEPYIPNPSLTYEENAQAQIEELMAMANASRKKATLEDAVNALLGEDEVIA